nr:helix-turn-helix domain-containing protein [Frankia gtarii]
MPVFAACDWPVVVLGIEPDRVHLFVEAHPEHSPSHVANQVDGFHVARAPSSRTCGLVRRAYTFLLRPTAGQTVAFGIMLDDHRALYNAALQERRDAYRHPS